jgi:DNA-binding response OmpR family regulator
MRVAIIGENEAASARLAASLLEGGASCHLFTGIRSFLNTLPRDSYDACILDSHPSGGDCAAFLQSLEERRQLLPVLILADEERAPDLVVELDGRHDFQLKPVRPIELRARLAALIRRATPGSTRDDVFEYDRFSFDLKTLEVRDNGTVVELTQKEFQLAMLLLSNIGKPLSRAHIRESVWGRNSEVPSRTLDTHVSRVRTKLNLRTESGYLLAPVYSYGYRLENLRAARSEPVAADEDDTATRGSASGGA